MKIIRKLTARQIERLMINNVAFQLLPSGEAEIEVADNEAQPEKGITMIKPTIGRVVWYFEAPATPEPRAALVSYVHGDRCVNLAVFNANGENFGATSVPLQQDGDPMPIGCRCEWMPYQKGQAAKTEALEAARA